MKFTAGSLRLIVKKNSDNSKQNIQMCLNISWGHVPIKPFKAEMYLIHLTYQPSWLSSTVLCGMAADGPQDHHHDGWELQLLWLSAS
jgi:hypothetical protein